MWLTLTTQPALPINQHLINLYVHTSTPFFVSNYSINQIYSNHNTVSYTYSFHISIIKYPMNVYNVYIVVQLVIRNHHTQLYTIMYSHIQPYRFI